MSEELHLSSPEKAVELDIKTPERPKGAEASPAEQAEQVEAAQATVAAETGAAEHVALPAVPLDERPQFIDKAIKSLRMRKNLSHVQSKLKPAEKSLSKAIHQPLVQLVSESAGKTVARPSGMLGGGLVAFVGSLGYLWLTRHYDLTYNYVFFLLFFVGGFALGVAAEYTLVLLHKVRR